MEALLQSIKVSLSDFKAPCEVILLDNSFETQRAAMESLAERYNALYQIGSDNLSEKRNHGIELAQYDVVLFLDSDCTVAPDLLQRHYDSYEGMNIAGCLGKVTFVGQNTFLWKAVERTSVLSCFDLPKFHDTVSWGPTSNISFQRNVLTEIGGFDPGFSRPGGEDVDLGFRLKKAGGTIVCNSQAAVYHSKETWASFGQVFRRFMAYGAADSLLIRKHPAHTVWDLPTPIHFLFTLFLFALVSACVTQNTELFVVPVLWIPLTLIIYPCLSLVRERQRIGVKTFALQALSLIIMAGLDLGRIGGALRQANFRALYRRVIFFDSQQIHEWADVATGTIASISALFLTFLLLTLMTS